MKTNPLLNTSEAARYLAVSKAFLERDRWAGPTVPFIRVGTKAVRYRIEDLDAFIESRSTRSAEARGVALAAARSVSSSRTS